MNGAVNAAAVFVSVIDNLHNGKGGDVVVLISSMHYRAHSVVTLQM